MMEGIENARTDAKCKLSMIQDKINICNNINLLNKNNN